MALSNQCNLAAIHEACPAHSVTEKKVLPTDVILDVVHVAGSLGYQGAFAWHLYNEPLLDDRIIKVCRMVKDLCPTSKGSLIWTNGDYLTAQKARCLWDNGVYAIRVSLYTPEAANRLRDVAYATPFINWHFTSYLQGFDERLDQYEPTDETVRSKPCFAPLTDLTIDHDGNLVLCCMDWRSSVRYSSVREGFRAALQHVYHDMLADQRDLSEGVRVRSLCRGCRRERPEDPNLLTGTTPVPIDYPSFDNTGVTFDKRNG